MGQKAEIQKRDEQHNMLRACILFHGRKVDEYVDRATGANVSIWRYNGSEYLISNKPLPMGDA